MERALSPLTGSPGSAFLTQTDKPGMSDVAICRSCGSVKLDDLGACPPLAANEFATPTDPGRLLRCQVCGLGQRHPVPDEQALIAMYRETPADHMDYRFEENGAWSLARTQLLARFAKVPAPTVLDVGCHTGGFLAGLPDSWRKHGIESAHEPIRIAHERHGVTMIGERLESIDPVWEQRFDAVTLFDVVEHLTNPRAGIERAARMLKPGGVLLLSSADFDAWTWRWLGSSHWYLQTPQHLGVISRRFLERVGRDRKMKLARFDAIPHRHAARRLRWREAIEVIYWGMRQRNGPPYRVSRRLLQSIPGLRDLRQMQAARWTMTLSDHVLVTYDC